MRKLALLLALVAWTASASASLTVTDDGTNFTITSSDAGGGLWEMKMLKTTGNIWSFKDLTDAGNGAGGHYNYLGQDGYNNQRSLLMFDGRDNNITVGGLALATNGSMAYSDIGTGLSSFTCTYTEAVNGNSGTYLYGGTYNAVTNGDVTTQIVVTINDATVAGTVINYSVTNTCHMDPADAMDGRYFATSNPGVSSFLADGRNQAGGNAGPGEGMNITRSIEAGSKWTMATVDASVLNQSADHGLTAGRSFLLEKTSESSTAIWDRGGLGMLSYNASNTWGTYDPATAPAGQTADLWWANIDGMLIADSYTFDSTVYPGDLVKESAGALTINIAAVPEPATMSLLVVGGAWLLRRRRRR